MRKLSGSEAAEYIRLLASIAQAQELLAGGGELSAGIRASLLSFVAGAKLRIGELEEKDRELVRQEQEQSVASRAHQLAEQEKALNAQEREDYRQFLEKDHFSRSDFGALEKFYSKTWNRLTEGGKDQMSHRVWEGVRQGEYRFTELPEVVQEKEALRVELGFIRKDKPGLADIPELDRSDFMRARADGKKQQSYEILERSAFTLHVAKAPVSATVSSSKTEQKEVLERPQTRKPGQPALEQVAVPVSMDSKSISLQEMNELNGAADSLKAPLPELKAAPVPKSRQ